MIKLIYLILLILIFNINIASSVSLVAETTLTDNYYINMSVYGNNINNQVIETIPKEVLSNVSSFEVIKFICGYNYSVNNKPDANLNFRLYIYSGDYILIDNNYITPSQCDDSYAYPITWVLTNPITVNHNYDYAIGFYSNSNTNNGSWQIASLWNTTGKAPYYYSWVNVTDGIYINPIINESIYDVNHNLFNVLEGTIRHISSIKVYGTLESSTPTPTPTPTPTGTDLPIDSGTGTNSTLPSIYNENSYTNMNNNSLPNNSIGFKQLLEDNGYASNIVGFVSMFQDCSPIFVIMGMLLFIAKLMRVF